MLQFPDRSVLRPMTVIPLYVELKPFSGERICGGIVVIDEYGKVEVASVEALSRLRCVYGEGVTVLELARTVALDSLSRHLVEAGALALGQWAPPVEGVALGEPLVTASTSVTEQLRAALLEYSSLAGIAEGAEFEVTPTDQRTATWSAARLLSAIQKAVAAAQPSRLARFSRSYRVTEDARPLKLGYVGPNIVANFATVFPSQLAARVNLSKAKLWDLAQAREGAKRGWFTDVQPMRYELLVHRPTESNVEYTHRQLAKVVEALAELEAEADRVAIRCLPLASVQAIAEHLLEVDA